MHGKTEKLKGRGRLVGPGIDADAPYEISVVTETIDASHQGNPTAVIEGLKRITGRVKLSDSVHPPFGQTLTLTLEDGRKLSVFVQSDGGVTATGGFFK